MRKVGTLGGAVWMLAAILACSSGPETTGREDRHGGGGGGSDGGAPGGTGGAGGVVGGPGGSGAGGLGMGGGGSGGIPAVQTGEHMRFWQRAHGVAAPVRSISADRGGNVWAANGRGLLLLRAGAETWELFTQEDGLPEWNTMAVAGGRDGQVWVGYEGLFPDANYFDDPPEIAKSGDVDLIELDGDGLEIVRHYDISSPPAPDYPDGRDVLRTCYRIVPVLEGRWKGDVWFGCNHGVAAWTEQYDMVQEHQHTAIWRDGTDHTGDFRGLAVRPDGNVWIAGAHNGGLLRYDDEGGQFWARIDPVIDIWPDAVSNDPRGDDWTMALELDESGGLWAGGFGNGLAYRAPDGTWSWLQQKDGLPDDRVYDLALDPDGSLWVATDAGLARVRDGQVVQVLDSRTGLPGSPYAVAIDDTVTPRRVLIGTSQGAGIYDGP